MTGIIRNRDFLAGLLFIAFGAAGIWFGLGYDAGTLARMGPGFFPLLVSGGLVFFGVATAVRSVLAQDDPLEGIRLRPVLAILAAVLVFALLLRPLGLVLSTVLLVIVAAAAGGGSRPREVVVLAVGLSVFVLVVFVALLGIPFRLWPG